MVEKNNANLISLIDKPNSNLFPKEHILHQYIIQLYPSRNKITYNKYNCCDNIFDISIKKYIKFFNTFDNDLKLISLSQSKSKKELIVVHNDDIKNKSPYEELYLVHKSNINNLIVTEKIMIDDIVFTPLHI
jgi:hypothetical protein